MLGRHETDRVDDERAAGGRPAAGGLHRGRRRGAEPCAGPEDGLVPRTGVDAPGNRHPVRHPVRPRAHRPGRATGHGDGNRRHRRTARQRLVNGDGTYTTRTGSKTGAPGRLTPPELAWLRKALEEADFPHLPRVSMGEPVPAAFIYAIRLAYAARRRATALLPLAVATAAAIAIAQTGDGMWRMDPALNRQVCDDSTPQVCVNSTNAKLLPQVSRALSGVTGRLKGVEGVPVRFEDVAGEPRADEVQLPMLEPLGQSVLRGRLTDLQQYAWEAAAALTWRDCDGAGAERLRELDTAVQDWLAPPPHGYFEPFGPPKQLPRLKAMGDEERRAWLSRYFATRGDCDPRKVPSL
ncbi:hypothetical protein NLX86_27680 [Streptomyces sp. A3M-1-3]|uniref:hypothetical protein n=1 Tax=Streptomyces sp. A3M-1-3 TaxID=2962044 RepID=UPI0020B736F9|nr:hypothetical protein [Streptomyces sp. A3M-1-3]MCP3821736.1 hypothetical protein [Streptomyces sp. A3M-1-3]